MLQQQPERAMPSLLDFKAWHSLFLFLLQHRGPYQTDTSLPAYVFASAAPSL